VANWGTKANRVYTDKIGLSKPHNNMPPYLVVNIWKRTASDEKGGDANARVIGNFSPSCTYTNSGNDRIITISGLRN